MRNEPHLLRRMQLPIQGITNRSSIPQSNSNNHPIHSNPVGCGKRSEPHRVGGASYQSFQFRHRMLICDRCGSCLTSILQTLPHLTALRPYGASTASYWANICSSVCRHIPYSTSLNSSTECYNLPHHSQIPQFISIGRHLSNNHSQHSNPSDPCRMW